MAPLLEALRGLTRWLQDTRTSGTVIGGVAASILGRPRFTRDIDAIVLLEEERWPEFLSSSARYGFHPLRHEPSGIDVDISFGSLPFEKELVARAAWKDVGGVLTPLPTVEDLIVMKAVAHRSRDLAETPWRCPRSFLTCRQFSSGGTRQPDLSHD